MPSEPDNKMDDLLKTYAKKRRDEAGAPFEMHPATRKLLQAEAAKLQPKAPERRESWFSALLAFWPRYALAATAFVVLGIGAWSFFRFEEQPKQIALVDAEQNAPRPESARGLEGAEKKESEVRQFRQVTGGERDSVRRPAKEPSRVEPQLALREESSVQLKAVADESKVKRNAAELAANEALQKNLKLNRPAPAAPPASAPVPAPIIAPASPSEKAPTRRLAAVDTKDKGALSVSTDTPSSAGKPASYSNAQRQNQQPPVAAENAPGYLNQGVALSYSTSAKPQPDALDPRNSVQLQLGDSAEAYNDGIAPLANTRAQELFGLTTNSVGGRLGEISNFGLNVAQTPLDNYSKLPQLQSSSAGANAQNVQFFRATEADALARQNSPAPAAQPSPPASVVAGTAGGLTGPTAPQTTAATGADRFYSRQGAVAQTSQSATQSRNRFSQVQSNRRGALPEQAGAAAAPVLAEFDFEQTGNRVRVVDADGSVYDGQIIEDAVKADDNSKERARRDAAKTVELRKAATKQTATDEGAAADSSGWNFRASGTNRTLQQPVTINGVLFATSTNLGGQTVDSARRIQQTTRQPANANLPPVQRIQGRVQVGTGAETQLDAVRRGN